jgi:hypothetical protein
MKTFFFPIFPYTLNECFLFEIISLWCVSLQYGKVIVLQSYRSVRNLFLEPWARVSGEQHQPRGMLFCGWVSDIDGLWPEGGERTGISLDCIWTGLIPRGTDPDRKDIQKLHIIRKRDFLLPFHSRNRKGCLHLRKALFREKEQLPEDVNAWLRSEVSSLKGGHLGGLSTA